MSNVSLNMDEIPDLIDYDDDLLQEDNDQRENIQSAQRHYQSDEASDNEQDPEACYINYFPEE